MALLIEKNKEIISILVSIIKNSTKEK